MQSLLIAIAVGAAAASGAVHAQSDVLKAKGCFNCHDMDKKKLGPGFKDIAAKYKDDKGAAAALVTKLKDGTGHMKFSGSDAELRTAVDRVLAAK
ncbi:MAG TPA: cytochrome C [Burkholderiales bacterium]|nr:cytochrome C [Burkholderiales bacterium]